MEIISAISEMQMRSEALRRAGQTLSLVPTMGFFHEGHLTLMRVAKKRSDKLIVSIFVNPIQFGPSEDYDQYPRDMEGDLAKAREVGVDFCFVPAVREMYPGAFQTKIAVAKMTNYLCGLSRPGHFDGVTTVVAKLFHITKPHIAVFGQKDYQQLQVITRMKEDLNMDIEILPVPTVREADGLAMSSRNTFLNPEERKSALCLKKSIDLAGDMINAGEKDAKKIKSAVETLIQSHPFTSIDYVHLCHPGTLEDITRIEGETVMALAVRVGKTRLIDNWLYKGASL